MTARRLARVLQARQRLRDSAAADVAHAELARRHAVTQREQRVQEREALLDTVEARVGASRSAHTLELVGEEARHAAHDIVSAARALAARCDALTAERMRLLERERQVRGVERRLEHVRTAESKAHDKREQRAADDLAAQAKSRGRS